MKYDYENSMNDTKRENTLVKYFFPEGEKRSEKNDKKMKKSISFEKVENYFKKPLKLRNALKQCYWDRTNIVFKYILRIEHIALGLIRLFLGLDSMENYSLKYKITFLMIFMISI